MSSYHFVLRECAYFVVQLYKVIYSRRNETVFTEVTCSYYYTIIGSI